MKLSELVEFNKAYLKSAEVAKIFNVDPSTVFLWVKKKKLKPIKTLGGNFRFAVSEVERLFKEMTGSKDEKRRAPRFHVNFPVQLSTDNNGSSLRCRGVLRDLSAEGLGLMLQSGGELVTAILTGNAKTVQIHFTDNRLMKENLTAEVRHAEVLDDSNLAVGLLVVK